MAVFTASSVGVRADDVNITTSTNAGVDLNTFVGTTARVFPGVTVDNTTPGTGISATTQAWTVTNEGTFRGNNSIRLTQGGAVTNAAGAQINASLSGITLSTINAGSAGSRTTGGFFTGMDVTMPGSVGDVWRVGLAGGYHHTSVDVAGRSSSGRIDSYPLAVYGGRQFGALGLRGGASYSWNDVSTSRSIVFPGFSDAAQGKYSANTAQVFGEAGYDLTWRQFALEPFAGLAHVNLHTNSFVEAGGAAALASVGSTSDTTYSTVGLRAATPLLWFNLSELTAKGSIGWRHAFGTVTPTAQLAFAAGTTPFVVAGVPIARDAAAVELGVEGPVWRNAAVGLGYTGQIANNADSHGINASFVQRF